MNKSYGFVEVRGLALAITTADLMVKSANVALIDAEKTNGGGWILVKVAGDIGAVQAAVEVGSNHAKQHNGLIAANVIARPDSELVNLLNKQIETKRELEPELQSEHEPKLERVPEKRTELTEKPESTQAKKSKKSATNKRVNVERMP
ncbi:BMC domain-containing protein [Shewanella sp. D64]|uniref:BMC domain-containing protein n=1 Tax=unclassified Shewanella TaxID=196818 RepID=UPI0022BA6152|nr:MULTISPECIES: BMC domain-containing protein [unclassified Shewanella]MEC4725578.1 BMC domain-containing protein [Shewanella sp. D64]MEC4739630.1 BMC domain-containing protein [Shewanella sp. E94]WBJ94903.1 BMC domain-containing protein [Shewanella sp. MTB7]